MKSSAQVACRRSAFVACPSFCPAAGHVLQDVQRRESVESVHAFFVRHPIPRRARKLRRTRCIWHSSVTKGYDYAESGHSEDQDIRWKDRVALYAQFSAEETLDVLLSALRDNNRSGPLQDDGIDALYAFANLDVWSITHGFFGRRKTDLGQFEKFKNCIVSTPYNIMLGYSERSTLSALRLSEDKYVSRISFVAPRRDPVAFTFHLSRVALGLNKSWMVDSITQEPSPSE